MDFSVGQKVLFKTWEEMKAEYGVNECGDIQTPFTFVPNMDEEINRDRVFTISTIDESDGEVTFEEQVCDNGDAYHYHVAMIKPVPEDFVKKEIKLTKWHMDKRDYDELVKNTNLTLSMSGTEECTTGYSVALRGLLLGTGRAIVIRCGHSNQKPNDMFEYLNSAFHDIGVVVLYNKTPEEIDAYLNYAKEKGGNTFKIGTYAACTVGKSMVAFGARRTMENDEFFVDFLSKLHDIFGIETEPEIYEHLVSNNAEAGVAKIVEFISVAKEMERRKEFENEVSKIEHTLVNGRKNSIKNKIEHKENEIESYERELYNLYSQLREHQKELAYLLYTEAGKDASGFTDIVLADYDSITKLRVEDNNIYFVIKQPLLFFNDPDWNSLREETLRNYRSRKYIIDAIFTRKATVLFEQGVRIKLGSCSVERWGHNLEYRCGIPNPHIEGWNCWGDNRSKIEYALRMANYDIAYTQIKSAFAGINLTDTPVLRRFCEYMEEGYSGVKCITDMETGIVMEIEEAEKYYEQKAKEEEAAAKA